MTPFTEIRWAARSAAGAVEAARAQGYAIDNEECEIGMRCVAVPVYNYTGHIIAGMSVTGPAVRMSMEIIAEKLPQFKGIAAALSRDLGILNHRG
jgi:DNA-binding IclR family transcriptional regulator